MTLKSIFARFDEITARNTGAAGESGFSADLAGEAARCAALTLAKGWADAVCKGGEVSPLVDVDRVMVELEAFRERARAILPVSSGGMGGVSSEVWEARLAEIGVSAYEAAEQPGYYGFTECDVDCYPSKAAAIAAAVLANSEALES